MLLPFSIIISLTLLLVASIGLAVNSKDKGKRKLNDTSFEQQETSSESQLPQDKPYHYENEPQHQASSLRHESTPRRVPKRFGLTNALWSHKKRRTSKRRARECMKGACVTSLPLNQVSSPLPQLGLEEMPAESTAQTLLMSRNKNTKQGERDYLKNQKQTDGIQSLNVELGVAAPNSSVAKWWTLDAYGQYIRWLERILLENQEEIRTCAVAENAQQPESLHIQLFELYVKNAEENEEYEQKTNKKMFRVDQEGISKNFDEEFEQQIQGISDKAEIKRLKSIRDRRKDQAKIDHGKWILFIILPKLEMKKPQDLNTVFAIDWAKKYAKSLREQFLKNYANEMEMAQRPNFFANFPSTHQPDLVTISDMQPNKELEQKELELFEKDVRREMDLLNYKRPLGNWLILDAYRRDILWLESLLLSNQHKILWLLVMHNETLIPTFYLLLKNAETNQAYNQTPAGDLFKLTPAEIANDQVAKKIHDALQTDGKNKTEAEKNKLYDLQVVMAKQALYAILPKLFMKKMPRSDIKTFAFEWARQYRKMLREDYLAPFKNVWKPRHDFMPEILKQKYEKSESASASASTKSTANKNRQKMKQKMHEH